jgi:LuxR family transcriptional regulator, maltose regulon positive regulatory protein
VGPLLETKLHIPGRTGTQIPRPRLSEQLTRGDGVPLTVISAPAGFGKSTVVTEWLASLPVDRPVRAWVSLDERDNDPATFWTYVLAALRTALGSDFGDATSMLLQSTQVDPDAVVATLLNELVLVSTDVVLVLDDYHAIRTPEIHEGVALLLERLPRHVRVVIASRVDPPLPLGRLRVGGRVVEVRAHDLRFTPDETAAYLERDGATLSAGDVATLAERTEGWVAALQLAALSMHGRNDISSFVNGFAGDDRFIVDYLVEEVLDRQTDDVRQFLLRTSILDRLNGSLCEAVAGQEKGRATLELLERANLFLVPLDDRRQWYRYHHLFADVLQAHLVEEQPDAVAGLHRRASGWYSSNGEPAEAVRHALAAGDSTLAADLAEAAVPAWRRDRQESTIRDLLQRLPDDVIGKRPVLMIDLVGARASIGEFADDSEARLDDAEQLVDLIAAGPSRAGIDVVVVRQEQVRSLPAAIEMYRAAIALNRGDLDGTRIHGRRALDMAPDDEHLVRAAAAALVGLASWAGGDIDAACEGYAVSIDGLRRAGHIADVLGCSITLADLRLAQGRLDDAFRIYSEALELGTSRDGAPLRGTADMHVGLSEVLRERGDLDAAHEQLRHCEELGEHNGLPQHPYRSRLAMARLCAAEGDLAAARALLDEAERVYTTDFSPSVRPIPAVRAGMLADHGDLGEALAWVRERDLGPDDALDYVGEFEHVVLARVLLAQSRADRAPGRVDDAARLLERLSVQADAGGRHGDQLQILVLLALAEDARGRRPQALAHLERAVSWAEPQGYVQVFVDEGPRLRPLLEAVATRSGSAAFMGRILDGPPQGLRDKPTPQPLVDPLSDRELQVLRLLTGDLTGPEIARELTVSLNTMRSHTKSIYAKLGVTNRRAAVRQADELQLLARPPRG